MSTRTENNRNPVEEVLSNLHKKHPQLFVLLSRLHGITGFVSVLGDDPRIETFRRSHHVDRVTRLTGWLCSQYPSIDREAAILVAVCHEVNRLPFAHNLEKRIDFDQAANLPNYLTKHEIFLQESVVSAITEMLSKNVQGSPEARLAYAADAAGGFIEDPLLAIITLNVPPSFIPRSVMERLGLDFNSPELRERIAELTNLFHTNPSYFVPPFNQLVFEVAVTFLRRYNCRDRLFVEMPDFANMRHALKEDFLKIHVFPINNEAVSQGSRLATEVGLPLMEAYRAEGRDPCINIANHD